MHDGPKYFGRIWVRSGKIDYPVCTRGRLRSRQDAMQQRFGAITAVAAEVRTQQLIDIIVNFRQKLAASDMAEDYIEVVPEAFGSRPGFFGMAWMATRAVLSSCGTPASMVASSAVRKVRHRSWSRISSLRPVTRGKSEISTVENKARAAPRSASSRIRGDPANRIFVHGSEAAAGSKVREALGPGLTCPYG